MEISNLKTYGRKLQTETFTGSEENPLAPEHQFPVTWNKSAFTGRFFDWMNGETKRLAAPLQKEQAKLLSLAKDLDKLSEEERRANREKAVDFNLRITKLDARIEGVGHDVLAKALAEHVLDSWGLTEKGVPVPTDFDTLRAQPFEFLQDLFRFCRLQSLPKAQPALTAGDSTSQEMTTSETSPSSTAGTKTTPPRHGPRSSPTPTTSG